MRTLIALAFLFALQHASAAQIAVQDDRGITLRLAAPARRIVSLAPHLTEIAYAAGAGARLVAVSAFSDYPPAALQLPRVGDGARVDIERILMLKPDLVLAWKSGNQATDIARLEGFGIAVWVSEASRLADIPRLLRATAQLAGTGASGEPAARHFEQAFERMRAARVRDTHARVRVFYEIWHAPLITVNREHVISEIIEACGGINVFGQAASRTPSVTLEALLDARPQLVLGGDAFRDGVDFLSRWRQTVLTSLRKLPVRFIPPDLMQRASPRLLDGMRAVCRHIDAVHAMQAAGQP
jgi:iron complex transport system substrate-binding protein